mgnify:FL=1
MKTQVTWFSTKEPTRFEYSDDAIRWHDIKATEIGPADTCYRATIYAEPGYVRVVSVEDGSVSNVLALPEPSIVVGLIVSTMMIVHLWRKRSVI